MASMTVNKYVFTVGFIHHASPSSLPVDVMILQHRDVQC